MYILEHLPQHPCGNRRPALDLRMIQHNFELELAEQLAQWPNVCPALELTLNSRD